MRVAVAGKGGAGKTTLSAALARTFARLGHTVVAIDADTNPNLAAALGANLALVEATPTLPLDLVSRKLGGAALRFPLADVLNAHATTTPDGVRLVRMGMAQHADEGCLCGAHAVGSALLADLGEAADTITIMDLEASPEHLSRGTARHADVLLLVAEPYFRSLETVRLQARLARELPLVHLGVVANKVRTQADADAIGEFTTALDLTVDGELPFSDEVTSADRAALSVLDVAPNGAVATAVADLAARLLKLGVRACA